MVAKVERVKQWAHTYTYTPRHCSLAAELWLPSGDDIALILHNERPVLASCHMLRPLWQAWCVGSPSNHKAVTPLWLLMNISLNSSFSRLVAADWLIHYRPALLLPQCFSTGHPSPTHAPRRSVDAPSIILTSPHQLCGPVNSAFLSCSASWWFTVLLNKLTVGITQCLNSETPYYSLMRRGSCRMADAILCSERHVKSQTHHTSAVIKPPCRYFDLSFKLFL